MTISGSDMSHYDRNNRGYSGGGIPPDSWRNHDKFTRDPHTGRYTRTPPARLPELNTPEFNTYRSNEDLRGKHFDRVPPVVPRQAFTRPDDLNSKGEEEGSEYSDEVMPQPYPQPYMYAPPQAYPVPGPPMMMVPAGYAIPGTYLPPQPHGYMQPPTYSHAPVKKVRYNERPTYYSRESPPHRERSMPRYVYEPKRAHEPNSRFSYINAQPQQDIPSSPSSSTSQAAARKMYLIPNKNKPKTLSKDHPYYLPSFDAAIDLLDEAVPPLIREIVVDATKELVTGYLSEETQSGNGAEEVVERMLDEAIQKEAEQVVRESVQEMAETHLQKASVYDVTTDLFNELIAEVLPDLLQEIDHDNDIEHVLETDILNAVVSDMARDVALETLEYYTEKAIHSEQRQIHTAAQKRLLDGVCLDHLLATFAKIADPPGMDEEVAAMHLTEDALLTILLEQYFALQSEPALTTDNKPVRRHHERAFSEVALDVLAEELCMTLDEDMADYDDYERDLWNPQKERPREWALYGT